MPPEFLELEDILEIHRDQITRYGGSGGVRDMALLQSALAVPRAGLIRPGGAPVAAAQEPVAMPPPP